ncbi:unnamed protein product [Soboliphyme baturini]|uniref:EGF-like domain-containing protein n=1 Tax=Soboliphyme baturini TaxID=241478 RepID=A0A183ISV4_9BILA|nr:unnamed protein product [Soboliphyme baturini]
MFLKIYLSYELNVSSLLVSDRSGVQMIDCRPSSTDGYVFINLKVFEIISNTADCEDDFLVISSVFPDGKETRIGRYCGSSYVVNLVSKTNFVKAEFHSNNRFVGKGFLAEYRTVANYSCDYFSCLNGGTCYFVNETKHLKCRCRDGFGGDHCQTDVVCSSSLCKHNAGCQNATCICSENFTGRYCETLINSVVTITEFPALINSLNYPLPYPANITQKWILLAPHVIVLRFKYFSIDSTSSSLQLFNETDTMATLTGTVLPPDYFARNEMNLTFTVGTDLYDSGFSGFLIEAVAGTYSHHFFYF